MSSSLTIYKHNRFEWAYVRIADEGMTLKLGKNDYTYDDLFAGLTKKLDQKVLQFMEKKKLVIHETDQEVYKSKAGDLYITKVRHGNAKEYGYIYRRVVVDSIPGLPMAWIRATKGFDGHLDKNHRFLPDSAWRVTPTGEDFLKKYDDMLEEMRQKKAAEEAAKPAPAPIPVVAAPITPKPGSISIDFSDVVEQIRSQNDLLREYTETVRAGLREIAAAITASQVASKDLMDKSSDLLVETGKLRKLLGD